MGKTRQAVSEFADIAFLLLGVLFGMVIMTFIFGQLGSNNQTFTDDTTTINDLQTVFINSTIFTIPEADDRNFTGGFIVVTAINFTGGELIAAGNYTVSSSAGTITNATAVTWANVSLNYTVTTKSAAELSTESVQNNSLQAIVVYTDQSSNQFNTLGIAITLVVLIGLFLLFKKVFDSSKKNKKGGGSFA